MPEQPEKFEPTWESLCRYTIPAWYQDAKFGIFIHWGLYSVPAFANEWYPRQMYLQDQAAYAYHRQTYGPQAQFGYKDFIPLFKAEKFDADAWADLFARAGARYVVPVAEHHDGFAMYNSRLTRWCAAQMGPCRDIIGELAAAVRRKGMVCGLSSHRAEHWWFMNGGRDFDSDVQDPAYTDFYGPAHKISTTDWNNRDWQPRPDAAYLEDWLARCCELVDQYQPQLFWFDWWIEQIVFQPYLQKFAAYYYNRGLEWQKGTGQMPAINYKNQAFPEQAAVLDIERGQLKGIRPLLWQNDTAVSRNSWGYITNQDYKDPADLIGDLVDVVSKNGCLLLNIGPRPDGTIPEGDQAILLEIGRWLEINGEAIYGTRPWTCYGEGPTEVPEGTFTDTKRAAFTGADYRFTQKGSTLYATALAWPGEKARLTSLRSGQFDASRIQSIQLLGIPGPLTWHQDENALEIEMPSRQPAAQAAVIKIEQK